MMYLNMKLFLKKHGVAVEVELYVFMLIEKMRLNSIQKEDVYSFFLFQWIPDIIEHSDVDSQVWTDSILL